MLGRYLAAGAAGDRQPGEARLWLERAMAQGIDEVEQDLADLPETPDPDNRPEPPMMAVVI